MSIVLAALHPANAAPVITQSAYDGARLVQQPDRLSALIGMQLFIPAGLDRQTPAENGLSALVAEDLLTTPVGPDRMPLRDALQAEGRIDYLQR